MHTCWPPGLAEGCPGSVTSSLGLPSYNSARRPHQLWSSLSTCTRATPSPSVLHPSYHSAVEDGLMIDMALG